MFSFLMVRVRLYGWGHDLVSFLICQPKTLVGSCSGWKLPSNISKQDTERQTLCTGRVSREGGSEGATGASVSGGSGCRFFFFCHLLLNVPALGTQLSIFGVNIFVTGFGGCRRNVVSLVFCLQRGLSTNSLYSKCAMLRFPPRCQD